MTDAKNLTEGSISAHLVRLAAPLIAGNILQQLYNAADAFVLGRCAGENEFAAIGVAGAVMNLFLFAIAGACTGVSVLFARFYGADDLDSFRKEHFLSFAFGLLATAAGSLLGIVCLPLLLRAVHTPEELCGYVTAYLTIIFASLPASFLYNLYNALLRSIGRASAALLALAFAVGINLALDLLFVAHLGWGITGAACATALSQVLSAALCMAYLRRTQPHLLFRRADCRIDRELLHRTAHYSFVTALHQSSLYIGKLLVQGAVNSGGTAMISAYTATTRIEGFANSFGDSGSAATSVLVSQNLGAGRQDRVRQSFRSSFALMLGMGLVCSAVMYVTAGWSVGFMLGASSGAAFEGACAYLRTVAVFYTLCFLGNTFAGYFDGVGRVSVPFAGAAGHISLRVVLSWLLIGRFGLRAVALATGIGWLGVNLFWGALYARSRGGEK